ncbi:hypothetical protein DCE79_10840 [Lysinibacillus sp. 2017]|uniref:hypothetical protein n=1 Tax=unclassified Lysinibacillus TaxID=2636778 RepID=UPI000D52984C|nr:MULTISPECIES: hypothetical protein [unclassified Lysinibacillus]AWE07852.1 hypothetical protein DCE79_10840 [Lysinibacillus sp. 2017]TGN32255.1 hypothetical protein E4L99_15530 [Lysinibacillus sp. S2017]
MSVDDVFLMVTILSIVICDGIAVYLYLKKRFPLWGSAIIIALLVPVIAYSFVEIGIDYFENNNTDPDYSGVEVGIAGAFMAFVLAINAIIIFVIGIILNVSTFIKNKKKHKNKTHNSLNL